MQVQRLIVYFSMMSVKNFLIQLNKIKSMNSQRQWSNRIATLVETSNLKLNLK